MHELNQHKIAALLPQRRAQSNKGNYGSVAAAAGSLAYRGAAALCVEGALRTGAGLVYLASVEPVIQLVLTRTPECCALPCRTDADGGILAADAAAVRQRFYGKACGPAGWAGAWPQCGTYLERPSDGGCQVESRRAGCGRPECTGCRGAGAVPAFAHQYRADPAPWRGSPACWGAAWRRSRLTAPPPRRSWRSGMAALRC